jgi:hypothetical protein
MNDGELTLATRSLSEPVEVAISNDIVKRGALAAPVLVGLAWLIWGVDGLWSSLLAVGLVLVNFAISARLIAFTAPISLSLMMGAVLGGFVIRLGLIMGAVLLVRDAAWISLPALGATIIVTHLGLLAWELKYVSASLAHPGLKPSAAHEPSDRT